MSRFGFFAALALICAVVAGCGGSSGPNAQEKQFVAQANAICAQELAVLNKTPEPTSPTQAIGYLPKALAIIQRQSTRLQALSVPASKRAELEAALASGRQLGVLLEGFLRKLHAGSFELATFTQVQTQSVTLREQINAHFRQAGLASCLTSA
ncbi:MAG TPA: hypothetical protein VGX51_12485 [Solirubrobacteraceae bacterium]|jgi:hypothetical protein|nr:hypothetical protein [Solirubrobacteraceae bacterium]